MRRWVNLRNGLQVEVTFTSSEGLARLTIESGNFRLSGLFSSADAKTLAEAVLAEVAGDGAEQNGGKA